MKCLDAFADSVGMSLSQLQETEKDKEAWHAVVHGIGHSSVTEQLYPDSDYITEILRWFGVSILTQTSGTSVRSAAAQLCVFTHVIHVYNFLTIFFLYTKVPPKPKGLSL